VQHDECADDQNAAAAERHRAECHQPGGRDTAGDGPEAEPSQQEQVLQNQVPDDRPAHAARSLLCMTVETKISSSVMRCTSRTVAPACAQAASAPGLYVCVTTMATRPLVVA